MGQYRFYIGVRAEAGSRAAGLEIRAYVGSKASII